MRPHTASPAAPAPPPSPPFLPSVQFSLEYAAGARNDPKRKKEKTRLPCQTFARRSFDTALACFARPAGATVLSYFVVSDLQPVGGAVVFYVSRILFGQY